MTISRLECFQKHLVVYCLAVKWESLWPGRHVENSQAKTKHWPGHKLSHFTAKAEEHDLFFVCLMQYCQDKVTVFKKKITFFYDIFSKLPTAALIHEVEINSLCVCETAWKHNQISEGQSSCVAQEKDTERKQQMLIDFSQTLE